MFDKFSRAGNGTWASLALFIVFLIAWEWGPALLGIPAYFIPPASLVFEEFIRAFGAERLLFHSGITAIETAAGFIIGSGFGMLIGYTLGVSIRAELILSPYILALQIAPKVAFAPLFVLWMGFTVYPKILVSVLIVFFPVMVNVMSAVRTVDPDLINLARTFSATRWQIFKKIEFPAALPPLFSGLRIAATFAIIGVVVGEMVGGNMGLGFVLVFAEGSANTALVFVSIILLTIVGTIAYAVVVIAEKRVLHYMPKADYHTI